jgi:hypothetical protein
LRFGRKHEPIAIVTYAILIYRAMPATQPVPEQEDKAALVAHRALQAEASRSGELHAVARLDEPSSARTIRWTESGHELSDGPYIETKEWLVGFYLVDCASEREAIARGKTIARDASHVIEVRPVTWRWKP